ncbi:MAG TPA: sulfatase-like hydrolase/transferase, partial [Opitutaceae bacterium]|nr:sulfatase-like hydrolase/transferase [Opitutaceae bacterium]
ARGMRFTTVWSNHPVCAAARTAIITGLHAHSSGGIHMRSMIALPKEMRLFPEYLRDAGYYCGNNRKEDYNVPTPSTTWTDSSARAHWRHRRPDQPFFAVFNSEKSHESQIRRKPHTLVTDPKRVRVPAYHPDTPDVRQDWAKYYDAVSAADAEAGKRLAELAEDGLTENTIVFYYGDHGSGMPRSKRWPSHSGLHVPLVVYFPQKWQHLAPGGYGPGASSDRLIGFVDLAPTLLSLAGIRPPEWMEGHAFAGIYAADAPAYLFGSRGRMDEAPDLVRSVTDGRYIYLRNFFTHVSQGQHVLYQFETPTTRIWRELFDAKKTNQAQSIFWQTPRLPEELYDLSQDRDEVHNLAHDPASQPVLARLRAALTDHLKQTRDITFLPEAEMFARATQWSKSPYELARTPTGYSAERVLKMADQASIPQSSLEVFAEGMKDTESGVRYWAAMGFLMKGARSVPHHPALREALSDPSPSVRCVAAEVLGRYGSPDDRQKALDTLKDLVSPDRYGTLITLAALTVVYELGDRASSLKPVIASISTQDGEPHPRYQSYVGRLVQKITAAGAP